MMCLQGGESLSFVEFRCFLSSPVAKGHSWSLLDRPGEKPATKNWKEN